MSDPMLFTTPEMAAVFSAEAHVRQMLVFEAALAIAAGCRVELFDMAALYREAAVAGTPAIPLVRMLAEQAAEDARKFVHWGATSQDAIDTAMVLQMRDGLDLIVARLLGLCEGC